jgi:hypothetical protein
MQKGITSRLVWFYTEFCRLIMHFEVRFSVLFTNDLAVLDIAKSGVWVMKNNWNKAPDFQK